MCGRREVGSNGGESEGVEGKEAGEVEVGAEEGKVGGEGQRECGVEWRMGGF